MFALNQRMIYTLLLIILFLFPQPFTLNLFHESCAHQRECSRCKESPYLSNNKLRSFCCGWRTLSKEPNPIIALFIFCPLLITSHCYCYCFALLHYCSLFSSCWEKIYYFYLLSQCCSHSNYWSSYLEEQGFWGNSRLIQLHF